MVEEEKERKKKEAYVPTLEDKSRAQYQNAIKKQENAIQAGKMLGKMTQSKGKILAIGAKANLKNIFNMQVTKKKLKIQAESKEAASNVYGFDRNMLGTPTSNSMMNSFILRNADVKQMDYLFHQMKKRKPDVQQIVQENQNTTIFENTEGIQEE